MLDFDKNPKDLVGSRLWRQFFCVPTRVILEMGVGMLEGARKYGRANWRASPVVTSVYIDAAEGHIAAFKMGEDIDEKSRLHHLIKAMCSLAVLRDALARGTAIDDRMPYDDVNAIRDELQEAVDYIFEQFPEAVPPWTDERLKEAQTEEFRSRVKVAQLAGDSDEVSR